jgi:hypothetical protein
MRSGHKHLGVGGDSRPLEDSVEGGFKLSEVLSALSYVLDMVEGRPSGHTIRSSLSG